LEAKPGAAQKKSKSKRSIENGSTQFLQPGGFKPDPTQLSSTIETHAKCQTFQYVAVHPLYLPFVPLPHQQNDSTWTIAG